MPETAVKAYPLATLRLQLALTAGGEKVMPPRALVTGIENGEAALEDLRRRLDSAAREGFGSKHVAVERPRFMDPGEGILTVVIDVVTTEEDDLTADRFAGGVTALTDRAVGPLDAYLSAMMNEPKLKVVVSAPYVTLREVEPPAKPPAASLTHFERRLARWITGVMFFAVSFFVLYVLW